MPSLEQALVQPDTDKYPLIPTEEPSPSTESRVPTGANYKTMFLISPTPLIQTNTDILNLFYRGGIPQTRLITRTLTTSTL